MTWYEILRSSACSLCGMPKTTKRGAWRRPFCESCEASVPDRLAWHLNVAMHNVWFMRWWRFGMLWSKRQKRKWPT